MYEKITPDLMTGRKDIVTDAQYLTEENVVRVVQKAMTRHQMNVFAIRYLRNYYKGIQPILFRQKDIRPEICNKVVVNRAYEITEFKIGYLFGEPVQFVQRGKCGFEEGVETEDNPVVELNEYMIGESKAESDSELASDMHITGVGYRGIFQKSYDIDVDECPFTINTLDPERTFVIKRNDISHSVLAAVTYIESVDDEGEVAREIWVYTDSEVYTITTQKSGFQNAGVTVEANGVGMIPIIEYPLNHYKMGCFEPALSPLDNLNSIESNRMDGLEQFIQSLLVLKNCDMDSEVFASLRGQGGLLLKSNGGGFEPNAEMLSDDLNQTSTQTMVDNTYNEILTITGVPDREASAGGNTGQALVIGQGWAAAEARAQSTETLFKKSERQTLKVMLSIIKKLDSSNASMSVQTLRPQDVEIKFTRNRTDNLLTKTQGLQGLLESGIHPRIAIATIGMFSDPEQVYEDSIPYMEKWLNATNTSLNSQETATDANTGNATDSGSGLPDTSQPTGTGS